MNASEKIDQYIDGLGDWRADMFERLRGLINEADPELVEEWKWNSAVWVKNGQVCLLGAFKKYVKVNFFKGAMLADPAGVMNAGLGSKTQRGVDIFEGDTVDEPALQDLVRAAVALNTA